MKSMHLIALAAVSMSLAATAAQALDFKTIGSNPAVMYDTPSERGRKVFVAPRGMPVEVVLTYGEWTKVRDATGDLSWVQSKMLTSKRNIVINVPNTKVYMAAEETASVVFTADKSVVLELIEPTTTGWLKVKHRDGQSGYVRAASVWGE